ncbi:hypothetical protein BD413DRAFT_281432 [Trametes elegans]|nr:hypothetical protein BD413DRAFT_281432 [Trametes elegans]
MTQSSVVSVAAYVNDITPVNDEGKVVCYHQLPAKRLTSQTSRNPNRDFYTCPEDHLLGTKCKFFIWADDHALLSVLESRAKASTMRPATPSGPSQAQHALLSRSPIAAAAVQKRQRTPSPTSNSAYAGSAAEHAKHRRVDPETGPTPSSMSSQKTEHMSESQKTARTQLIQEAINAVKQARDTSFASSSQHAFTPNRSRSNMSPDAAPSSRSHNARGPQNIPGPSSHSQTDAGASEYAESVLPDTEDMESIAVQPSLIDDDESTMEDFWSMPPSFSDIGSPDPTANVGAGPSSRPYQSQGMSSQASEPERRPRTPAPPQTPGRTPSSHAFAPGGNRSGSVPSMLLTPPGSSQPRYGSETGGAGPSTPQRGRALLQEVLTSPTASKGNATEPARPAHANQRWQLLPDDPENPFRAQGVARLAGSPAPTATSVSDSVGGGALAEALSAGSIGSHIAALQAVSEYIAKLERREKAARKSAEIKGRKIAQLEEEVQRLRNEKRTLEATVAALQVRR